MDFFVFCTPIADAGVLFDFPFRLITGIKMIFSEIGVWLIALVINFFIFFKNPHIYDKTIFFQYILAMN